MKELSGISEAASSHNSSEEASSSYRTSGNGHIGVMEEPLETSRGDKEKSSTKALLGKIHLKVRGIKN